jgi:proton-translocating NADH-quinone oxidoreductase chain N
MTLWAISPQLVLLVTGLAILVVDVWISQRNSYIWAQAIALMGIIGGAIATLTLWGPEERIMYVLQIDVFTCYGWILVLGSLAVLVVLSERYLSEHVQERGLFYALLVFCGLAAFFVMASINLIILVLGLDFLSIVSYILTGFLHEDQRSTEAAIKYLIYGAIVSSLMMYGFSWLYGISGTTDYMELSQALRSLQFMDGGTLGQTSVLFPLLIFILAGLGFKIALVPFHQWAPDAYEGAPTVVTALLAVIPKIAGFIALIRLAMTVFPSSLVLGEILRSPTLLVLSAFTMTFGNLSGLWQDRMKRLMAYSGIAQSGYILMGLALATQFSLQASVMQLSVYVISELGAFAVIVFVSVWTDSDRISDFNGLYAQAPLLAIALLVSLLSLIGIPGTGGFIGKFMLIAAAVEGGDTWLALIAGLNSVVALGYYWKIIRALFVQEPRGLRVKPKPAAIELKLLAVASIVGLVLLGLFPSLLLSRLSSVVGVFSPF